MIRIFILDNLAANLSPQSMSLGRLLFYKEERCMDG